jgi:hypothetical protein
MEVPYGKKRQNVPAMLLAGVSCLLGAFLPKADSNKNLSKGG